MSARQMFGTATEWTFRTAAVREARAAVASLYSDDKRAIALRQARLVMEVAARVQHPAGRLPKGSRPAALLGLYRDAIYWALAARRPSDAPPPPDLEALWAGDDNDDLARLAGGAAALAAARRALLETPASRALDVSAEDAAAAGTLATALVGELDAARTRTSRLVAQRWLRILLILAALLGVVLGVLRLIEGANLASGAKLRVSSSYPSCATDPICSAMLFHTESEYNPWVELDLGAPKTIHRVEITNRVDCCTERAIPLVVETSTDRVQWKPAGRRDSDFSTWTAEFAPRIARYVKLSVPRNTAFHLQDVAIR
jgi:hypothetical protein